MYDILSGDSLLMIAQDTNHNLYMYMYSVHVQCTCYGVQQRDL